MAQPLYAQLFETLLDQIARGELAPGAMLPSEMELAKEHGVSQGTARKALMMLEQEKLVDRHQGRGTFVTVRTPESALFHFFRFQNLAGESERPELVSETVSRRRANATEKAALADAPESVFEVTRLRSFGRDGLTYERSIVPTVMFPGLQERAPLPNNLYVFYQQVYSCIVMRADEKLRACAANSKIADILGLKVGAPVLEVIRVAFDLRKRAVERRISVSSTERHRYAITLS